MSNYAEAKGDPDHPDYTQVQRNPYKAIPGKIHYTGLLWDKHKTCCDDLPSETVKVTAESLCAYIDGHNRQFIRPKELGTWSHVSGTQVNERLCENEILKHIVTDAGGFYFRFTCFTKAWAHYTANKLKTRPSEETPSGHNNKETK